MSDLAKEPRDFCCYWHFIGWHCWSLGIHVDLTEPLIDLHLPGGFARLGWTRYRIRAKLPRTYGIQRKTAWERDCREYRGRVLTGQYGHWCPEWDELPIDETCPEWPCGCGVIFGRSAR